MKKIIISIGLLLLNTAYAVNQPHLNMHISGDVKNTYYLCVSNAGCVNLSAAIQGKQFPMNAGNVNYIFMTNAAKVRMYPQPLPDSCRIELTENQTLLVSGMVTKSANDHLYIKGLRCSIA